MTIQPLDIAIDVSHWQGMIDWPKVFAAGIRIAMLKASEGASGVDNRFVSNRRAAEDAGLVAIPYHFLRPINPGDQVKLFRSVALLDPGMAYALDLEGRASQTASPADAEAVGNELAALLGRPPLGYWGIAGSTPAAPTARMRLWPRWLPRYPVIGVNSFAALPPKVREHPALYWPDAHNNTAGLPYFGQYTSWGRVSGIDGLVDRSVAFFPTVDAAIQWCRGGAPQKAAGSVLDAPQPAAPAPAAGPGSAPPAPPQRRSAAAADTDSEAERLNQEELARLGRAGA